MSEVTYLSEARKKSRVQKEDVISSVIDMNFSGQGYPNTKYKEILKLKQMLEEAKIPFEIRSYYGGFQMAYPNQASCECSIIEHDGSYGRHEDLLEIYGLLTEEEEERDYVLGFLCAENVFNRINQHYQSTLDKKTE